MATYRSDKAAPGQVLRRGFLFADRAALRCFLFQARREYVDVGRLFHFMN